MLFRSAESKTADLLRSALVQPMEKVRISEATPLSRSVAESATLLMAEMEGALTPPKVVTPRPEDYTQVLSNTGYQTLMHNQEIKTWNSWHIT